MKRRWFVPQLSRRTLALVLALTALGAITLSSRVYTSFEGVRIKVVREPRVFVGSELTITMPETPRWSCLSSPVVLIARLGNSSDYDANVTASLKGERLSLSLPANDEQRLDLVVPDGVSVRAGDVLTFHVETAGAVADGCCTLAYLEVANIHGASNSIPSFIIVPPGSHVYAAPGWGTVTLVTIAIAWLLARGASVTHTRRVRLIQNTLMAVVALLFAVAVASTLVALTVVLSSKSFALGALALTWPGIVRTWRELRAALATRAAWAPRALEATVAAGVVALFYGLVVQTYLINFGGNYSGFLNIGRTFADRDPFLAERPDLKAHLRILDGGGYDGQFFYYIAFDPFLLAFKNEPIRYRDVVDAPPYRFGRIGFSLLTKAFALNVPERYPQTMMWLIVAASFAGAWCLAALAQQCGYSAWWALLYVLVPGFLQSLRTALPEAIAAAGLLGGYWLFLRARLGWAAVLFGASLLIRETGIVFVIALATWTAWRSRDRRGALILAASIAPFLLWRAYLGWRLFADFGWQAIFFDPQNLGLPFKGIADLWQRIHGGGYFANAPDLAMAGTYYPLLLIAALIVAIALLWRRPGALAIAAVAYALIALSLNYAAIWLHVGNAERGTYESILLLIIAFVSTDRAMRRTRLLLGGFMACALVYLWLASVDATLVRYVVLSSLS